MHDAGGHGSMAKSRILRSVKHSNRSLMEHRNRSLVDLGGLGMAQIRRSANVRFLRAAVNVSSEVIPGHKQILQYRIREVHDGIDHRSRYSTPGDENCGLG